MSNYNHRKDFIRFETELSKEIQFFTSAGMKPEDIKVIEEYTRHQHNRDRVYNERNISLYAYSEGMEEEGRSLYINSSINVVQKSNRKRKPEVSLDWIESVNDEKLLKYLKRLKTEWKIILTEIAINDKTITEVAKKLDRDRKTIRKIYTTILEEIRLIKS